MFCIVKMGIANTYVGSFGELQTAVTVENTTISIKQDINFTDTIGVNHSNVIITRLNYNKRDVLNGDGKS
ncbi:MAG: hypothetical protein LBB13_00830 [Rickettsiales bacterium]|nr:hypothetical protein [Rickettsiales bacterium]